MTGRIAMGTIKIQIPLVTWRDGKPRYYASKRQRELGFKGESLRHGAEGEWFSVDECKAWSDIMLARIEKATNDQSGKTHQAKGAAVRQVRSASELVTLSQVIADFLDKDPGNQGKIIKEGRKTRKPRAANTVKYYHYCAVALEKSEQDGAWHKPVANCTVSKISQIIHNVEVNSGLSTARGVRALLSVAFGFAVTRKIMKFNPVKMMEERMPVPEERIRPAEFFEVQALVMAADKIIGRPEIADCIILAVCQGARQEDRLQLSLGAVDGNVIHWTQQKTNSKLAVPMTRWLAQRTAQARARRQDWVVQPTTFIVDEKNKRPFKFDWYRKLYAEVRKAAVKGDASQNIAPCPSVADLRDQDLRDTALTWLDRAGCDDMLKGAISGHAFARKAGILRHYVDRHDPVKAAKAIALYDVWLDAQFQQAVAL